VAVGLQRTVDAVEPLRKGSQGERGGRAVGEKEQQHACGYPAHLAGIGYRSDIFS
jgi:hypothetical protein